MAITKKPKSNQRDSAPPKLAAEDRFIAGAAESVSDEDEARKPVLLRFDRALLKRVDAAAKRRGISRSAWIQYTVSAALDADKDKL